jgi:hypothetical protein
VSAILGQNKATPNADALSDGGAAASSPGLSRILAPSPEDGVTAVPALAEELVAKLQRPIQQTNDQSVTVRKTALQQLHDLFIVHLSTPPPPLSTDSPTNSSNGGSSDSIVAAAEAEASTAEASSLPTSSTTRLPAGHLSLCLDELSKPLMKRFEDASEKCRELSVKLMTWLVKHCKNLVGSLPYLWPAVMRRVAKGHAYDHESCIFVHDKEAHEAWKRGAATARQDMADRGAGGEASAHTVRTAEQLVGLLCGHHELSRLSNSVR